LLVDIAFIAVGVAVLSGLAVLFMLQWGQRFPGLGRFMERQLGRVSPRLGRWTQRLLSEDEQRG